MIKILLFTLGILLTECSSVLRPKGVPLQKAPLYDPGKPFVCFDGSNTILFKNVNDDYCDCKDGSDEPGTSACSNGTFYCDNIGHEPKKIPSSWVNDGVCDCCDTTDEYASGISCINNCEKLGNVARVEAEAQRQDQIKGYNLRQQLVEEGLKLKKETQTRLSELETELEQAEKIRTNKLEAKEVAEIPEKEALEKYKHVEEELKRKKEEEKLHKDEEDKTEAFNYLDSNGDGIISQEEFRSKALFDQNKDGEVSEDEAKFFMNQSDNLDFDGFVMAWPLIKPVYKYGKNMFTPPTSIPEPEDVEQESPDEQYEDDGSSHEDVEDVDHEDEEKEAEQVEEEPEESVQYDEETQRLVDAAQDARNEYETEDKKVRDINDEINNLKKELEKDFGPNEEFRSLYGKCLEYSDRQYTYKLCPFDYATQKQKNGPGDTRLGSWGQWTGPADSPYSAMKYTGGQGCWNGPNRSAEVSMLCGTESEILSVSEPNRCEYLYVMTTPAVCTQPTKEEEFHQHIEL